MTISNLLPGGIALGLCTLLAVGSVIAQGNATLNERNVKQRNTNRLDGNKVDKKMQGNMVRASQLTGMNIYTPNGESLGEINDIVLDCHKGKIAYAAVTYGGFLGMGDKMFAVPFEAFKTRTDPDDRDETMLTLDVTQQKLEGAQGFNQDNWPNFADKSFAMQFDKRYGVDRKKMQVERHRQLNNNDDN
ncbi:PRC-barrel domain-containing protein [Adhaeretor mobilis]|uniref:PRC-barrel domain protein n=1 Tax=Adhaeretor mobilis TaxID=1930276 RepID=A0A517N0S1_9BACT|nr:PRC-barrel domain-containing protein [Adhaeretor mobilis]QDT00729.1 PRC-barrel domain protein [Adhaeretor mobilis]